MDRRRLSHSLVRLYLNSSVIGYEKDSQQENSYHHHRDSVPNCTTFSVMFSCFHKLNLFCVQHQQLSDTETLRNWLEAQEDSIMIVYRFAGQNAQF